jgi:predicted nucleic acid-binding protein
LLQKCIWIRGANTIALALEIQNLTRMIDKRKSKEVGKTIKLRYSESFGLILSAKRNGYIKSLKPFI